MEFNHLEGRSSRSSKSILMPNELLDLGWLYRSEQTRQMIQTIQEEAKGKGWRQEHLDELENRLLPCDVIVDVQSDHLKIERDGRPRIIWRPPLMPSSGNLGYYVAYLAITGALALEQIGHIIRHPHAAGGRSYLRILFYVVGLASLVAVGIRHFQKR